MLSLFPTCGTPPPRVYHAPSKGRRAGDRPQRGAVSMHVAAVIKRKGSDVVTIASDRTIAEAVNVLAECRIGAILVMDDNDAVGGIISECDRRPPAVAGRRRSHGRQGTHPKRQREREPRHSLPDAQDHPAEDEQGLVAESAGPLG